MRLCIGILTYVILIHVSISYGSEDRLNTYSVKVLESKIASIESELTQVRRETRQIREMFHVLDKSSLTKSDMNVVMQDIRDLNQNVNTLNNKLSSMPDANEIDKFSNLVGRFESSIEWLTWSVRGLIAGFGVILLRLFKPDLFDPKNWGGGRGNGSNGGYSRRRDNGCDDPWVSRGK